jgi:hypothetical protein
VPDCRASWGSYKDQSNSPVGIAGLASQ